MEIIEPFTDDIKDKSEISGSWIGDGGSLGIHGGDSAAIGDGGTIV